MSVGLRAFPVAGLTLHEGLRRSVSYLKENRRVSNGPVVFLIADEQNADIEQAARDVPAVDSLGKPFSPAELAAKIASALSGSDSPR